jgi:hypothetical protein
MPEASRIEWVFGFGEQKERLVVIAGGLEMGQLNLAIPDQPVVFREGDLIIKGSLCLVDWCEQAPWNAVGLEGLDDE